MKSSPGSPVFSDIEALRRAAQRCGCELVKQKTYHWYGRSVGDTPLPPGMVAAELGRNATYVVRLTAETKRKYNTTNPYEVGIVADANNPGCFIPVYDSWNGGFGVDQALGKPVTGKDGEVLALCPKLVQHYQMVCASMAAEAVGDSIEFLTLKAAHEQHPELFPNPSQDEETYVSLADTSQRLGVN